MKVGLIFFSLLILCREGSAWCTVLSGLTWPCGVWEAVSLSMSQVALLKPKANACCRVYCIVGVVAALVKPQESGCLQ